MTHLTGFSRLLARHASRHGLVEHKRSITTSSGRERPAFGGPNSPIRCASGACPMPRIALRIAPAGLNEFGSIKWVNNSFLWYDT